MRKLKLHNYFVWMLGVALPTFASLLWISSKNYTKPPVWALCLAMLGVAGGIMALAYVMYDIYRHSPLSGGVPGTRFQAFQELLDYVPEAKGVYEQLRLNVRGGEINPGTSLFESHINEMRLDLKTFIRSYFLKKRNEFMRMFFAGISCTILIFACLYLVDYTIEIYFSNDNKPGFSNVRMPKGNILEWAWDGIYFSVVTFATLGYGDITPNTSVWARSIAMVEVITFLFVFAFGLNFALSFVQSTFVLDPEDLTDVLRDELEKEAGGTQL